jgi:hypothetical protein
MAPVLVVLPIVGIQVVLGTTAVASLVCPVLADGCTTAHPLPRAGIG